MRMAKELWEANGKNVTTKGGVFVAVAAKREHAKMLAAAPKLVSLLLELHPNDENVRKAVEEILK